LGEVELRFGGSLPTQITDEGGEPVGTFRGELHDGKLDRKFPPVAMHALDLDALTQDVGYAGGKVTLEPALMTLSEVRRYDGLAHQPPVRLRGAPTEDALGLGVPADDPTIAIDADDGIQSGLDDPPAVRVGLG
jgi:hypothetical protein